MRKASSHAVLIASVDGDRMVACSGMTGKVFQDLFDPWLVSYERSAGGWERVQELQIPMCSLR